MNAIALLLTIIAVVGIAGSLNALFLRLGAKIAIGIDVSFRTAFGTSIAIWICTMLSLFPVLVWAALVGAQGANVVLVVGLFVVSSWVIAWRLGTRFTTGHCRSASDRIWNRIFICKSKV